MVKHVILWTLKNEYSKEEKEAIKAEIKAVRQEDRSFWLLWMGRW